MPSSSWVTRHNYALFGLEPPAKPKPADQRIQFEKDKNRAITEAETVITRWNNRPRGMDPMFYPTLAAAILTKRVWLIYWCGACNCYGETRLQERPGFNHHPIPAVRCSCSPDVKDATMIALNKEPMLAAMMRAQMAEPV